MDKKPSRAFDPAYRPTKSFQDLAKEYPDNPGIRMMADRERYYAERTSAFRRFLRRALGPFSARR